MGDAEGTDVASGAVNGDGSGDGVGSYGGNETVVTLEGPGDGGVVSGSGIVEVDTPVPH